MVIAFNTVIVIRLSFHLACVAYHLIQVRSEREFPASSRIGVTATHSAAAAVVCVGLPSFLPSARLRTTM